MKRISRISLAAAVVSVLFTGILLMAADHDSLLRQAFDAGVRFTSVVEFPGLVSQQNNLCNPNCPTPAPDPVTGQLNFGLDSAGTQIAITPLAEFQGQSVSVGAPDIVANGRACVTCHRPDIRDASGHLVEALQLGLPRALPLSNAIPLSDPLFTGHAADDNNHPDGFNNLNNHALFAMKPGRFNPLISIDSPFRQLEVWRRSNRLLNTAFGVGMLHDNRGRDIQEVSRGAIFAHTQSGDIRFDDLLRSPNPNYPNGPPDFEQRSRNIAAFVETVLIDPPQLKAFLNPADPVLNPACSSSHGASCTPADCIRLTGTASCDLYTVMVADPFFTVSVTTPSQASGRDIFKQQCMSCHNTPNVFSNIDHVPGNPLSFPPRPGRTYDIGVAQRNKFNLDFRTYTCPPGLRPCTDAQKELIRVVLPLAKEDGTVANVPVIVDPGVAGGTGRYEDLYRFKVPQLRRVSQTGPYFHDNSAATLEEVLDFLTSDAYANSADGKQHPIQLTPQQRLDLLAFLRNL